VAYLDASALLSYYFAEDSNHTYAVQLMETLRRRQPHYAKLSQKEKVAAVVADILKHADAWPTDNTPAGLFQKAAELAHALRLKTLGLLHTACALHLAERGLMRAFVAPDREVAEGRDAIERLGPELLTPWTP
jgi:predicted nucleic acid-binding protein